MPQCTVAILLGMRATIHTACIRTWVKCTDMNNTKISCQGIVYGVCHNMHRDLLIILCFLHYLLFISALISEASAYTYILQCGGNVWLCG